MSAADLERLLWDLADGTIGAEDRARLEAHLARHPEDRAQLDRIRALGDLFASIPEIEPPPALRRGIERALASRALPREEPASWTAVLRELVAPRWPVRLAWAAVGLVLGAGVILLMLSDLGRVAGRDETKFYGAMHEPTKDAGAAGLALEVPPSLGRLTVWRQNGELTFDLAVRDAPRGAMLELAGDGMALVSFGEVGVSVSTLRMASGRLTVIVEEGGRIKVSVGSGGGPVRARLSSGGTTVLDRLVAKDEVPGR